jgi:hypothetical protein
MVAMQVMWGSLVVLPTTTVRERLLVLTVRDGGV